jgi:antitoxin component HigA of HigAB toxin-antitoxin module
MRTATRNVAADSYMELIAEFPLRRIKSIAEHRKATRLVLRLSAQQPDRGVSDYLDVLVDLIADFERRSGQDLGASQVSAGDIVRHRIDERGMSVSALARLIGVPQSNLSEMLNGKRDWSKAAIRGLCTHLNMRAERFLA